MQFSRLNHINHTSLPEALSKSWRMNETSPKHSLTAPETPEVHIDVSICVCVDTNSRYFVLFQTGKRWRSHFRPQKCIKMVIKLKLLLSKSKRQKKQLQNDRCLLVCVTWCCRDTGVTDPVWKKRNPQELLCAL